MSALQFVRFLKLFVYCSAWLGLPEASWAVLSEPRWPWGGRWGLVVSPKLPQMILRPGDCAGAASAILMQKHAFSPLFLFSLCSVSPWFPAKQWTSCLLLVVSQQLLLASVSIDYRGWRIVMLRSQLNIIFSFNLEISFRVTFFFFFCNLLPPFFKFLKADPACNRREHVSSWLTSPSWLSWSFTFL